MSSAWPCKGPFCSKPGRKMADIQQGWFLGTPVPPWVSARLVIKESPLTLYKSKNMFIPINVGLWDIRLLSMSNSNNPKALKSYHASKPRAFLEALFFSSLAGSDIFAAVQKNWFRYTVMTPLLIHYCGNQNSPWIRVAFGNWTCSSSISVFLEEFHFHLQEGFSSPPLFSFQMDLILSLTSMGCMSNSICAAVLPSSFSWIIKRSASSPQMQHVGDFYREPSTKGPPFP